MNLKWKVLFIFVGLYLLLITGAAWYTYDATSNAKAIPIVEVLKIIFIMLGGLGVILPTYLNIWQSLETAELIGDQIRRSKIENTFRLLEKWDDKALLDARKFTRELKEQQNSLSPDEIKSRIKNNPELKQSIILLFNYFDLIRISIKHDRVDRDIVKQALAETFNNIAQRFKPWTNDQTKQVRDDLEELSRLLLN